MPYKSNEDLPEAIRKHLPKHAQDIYRKAFNNAIEEYQNPLKRKTAGSADAIAAKVAWTAVKKTFEKRGTEWVPKTPTQKTKKES